MRTRPFRIVSVIAVAVLACPFASGQAGGDKKPAATKQAADNPAVTAAPRAEDWWQARQKVLNERVKQGGAELLFIGDSITQGWEGEGKEVWAKLYAPRKAVNLGIGGDQTQHVLWRLKYGNLDGIAPKVAVVMIGTNNTGGGQSADQIAAGVKAITDELGAKLPKTKVLLLAIFPRGDKPNAQRDLITAINAQIARLADDKRVWFRDIGAKFVNADGTISKEIMPDFLHLSPKGYGLWADAIEADLKKLLGEK
jgi:lysophospholipase L1-like esterase